MLNRALSIRPPSVCVCVFAVEPYLPEPFCPKPTPLRQPVLPPPAVPGAHGAPTMLLDSMQWGPGRAMHPPPPYVTNSQPPMPPFSGVRGGGYSSDVGAVSRPANLIVVPTRSEERQKAGTCSLPEVDSCISVSCYLHEGVETVRHSQQSGKMK